MSNKEFYQTTFAQVRGHKTVRWEDFERMKKQKSLRRIAVLAAVAALLAAFTSLAVAADWFGVRELLLPQKNLISPIEDDGMPGDPVPMDVISLSGFMDTPESKALAEWNAFLESYDQDGTIIASIGNSPTGFEERYGNYLVYTQEMADKLEEILAKYNLQLHMGFQVVMPEMWPDAVGAAFLADNHTSYSGYIYEDGTFQYDGAAEIPGYGTLDYQLRRTVRGSFDDVILNITDASQFQEWKYQTVCGVTVNLALSPTKALVITDSEDSFVAVNVLAGTDTSPEDVFSSGGISKADLEAFADGIDFTVLSEVRKPDMEQLAWEEESLLAAYDSGENQEDSDPLYEHTGIEEAVAETYVKNLAELISNGERLAVAELFVYPCKVTVESGTYTVEGARELLDYYDEAVESDLDAILSDLEDGELFAHDGLVGVGNGTAWFGLVEDGDIRLFTLQGSDGKGVQPAEPGITAG